jgi:hypothetical protein
MLNASADDCNCICGTGSDLTQSRLAMIANKSEARRPGGTMGYLGLRGVQTALRGVRGGRHRGVRSRGGVGVLKA